MKLLVGYPTQRRLPSVVVENARYVPFKLRLRFPLQAAERRQNFERSLRRRSKASGRSTRRIFYDFSGWTTSANGAPIDPSQMKSRMRSFFSNPRPSGAASETEFAVLFRVARHVPTKFADSARFAPAFHADGPIQVPLAGHFPSITVETTYVVSSSISTAAVPRR